MLLARIWGDSAYRDPRTIDVHIRHLREKIERDPKDPEYLFTVRGVGYRFRDTEPRSGDLIRRALHSARTRSRSRRADSLRNRLALIFFAITLLAIAVLYLYVAPGLQIRLLNEQLDRARRRGPPLLGRDRATIGTVARGRIGAERSSSTPACASGDRVTLLSVSGRPAGSRSSSRWPTRARRRDRPGSALRAALRDGRAPAGSTTGTESAAPGSSPRRRYPLRSGQRRQR